MQTIGFDRDGNYIYISLLDRLGDVIDNKSFKVDLKAINVKLLYIDPVADGKKYFTCTSLDAEKVLIKPITLKTKKKSAIKKAIDFQAKTNSPIDEDKLIYSVLHNPNSIDKNVIFFYTNKENVQSHIDDLKSFKISTDHIASQDIALSHFVNFAAPNLKDFIILHMREEKTICVYVKDNFPISSCIIEIGKSDFERILQNQKNQTDNFLDDKNRKIQEIVKKLSQELLKVFLSFSKELKEFPVIFTGFFEEFQKLDEAVLKFSKKFVDLRKFENDKITNYQKYAISIGTTINSTKSEKKSIEFRKKEFINPKHLTIAANRLFYLFGITVIISLSLFTTSKLILKNKERKLNYKFQTILLDEKDQNILDKISKETELLEKIYTFEDELENEGKNFPFFLKAPNVTKTLHWILNTSFFKNENSLALKNFYYELKSFPYIGFPNEKTQVQVFLTFKSKNNELSKNFHDFILKDKTFINTNEKITWDVDKNKITTSFYLKILTPNKIYAKEID